MFEVGQARQVPGAAVVPADVGEDPGARACGLGDPGGALAGREGGDGGTRAGREVGCPRLEERASGGGSWPWETIVRSPSYAMETVTEECQPGTVREVERSMCSPCSSASQQYSP